VLNPSAFSIRNYPGGPYLIRNYLIRNYLIRNYLIRNYLIRNYPGGPYAHSVLESLWGQSPRHALDCNAQNARCVLLDDWTAAQGRILSTFVSRLAVRVGVHRSYECSPGSPTSPSRVSGTDVRV
jgi:hypothetical protein